MDRREVLRLVSVGVGAVGAGCSRLDEMTTSPPYLERVRVRNTDAARHGVSVVVEQDGEKVHETTFELGPREPREYGIPYTPGEHIRCEWSGSGPFEVSCTVDDERTTSVRLDRSDTHSERHASVTFTVGDAGRLESEVLSGGEPVPCE